MADLRMSDEKEQRSPDPAEKEGKLKNSEEKKPELPKGDMERFYENFRNVPVKYLDAFILLCFILLIAVIVFGVWRAGF